MTCQGLQRHAAQRARRVERGADSPQPSPRALPPSPCLQPPPLPAPSSSPPPAPLRYPSAPVCSPACEPRNGGGRLHSMRPLLCRRRRCFPQSPSIQPLLCSASLPTRSYRTSAHLRHIHASAWPARSFTAALPAASRRRRLLHKFQGCRPFALLHHSQLLTAALWIPYVYMRNSKQVTFRGIEGRKAIW